MIAFKFGLRDRAICGAQVREHCINGYIGKAKDAIVESGKVDVVNSSKDLLFDLFLDCGGGGKFF